MIGIGGFEYDLAPIDVYFFSGFCSNVTSYAFGGSVGYALSGNDQLTAQMCESPFSTAYDDIYAYNLLWQGKHGCWSTLYSLNMVEYMPGKFVNYIALGNQFNLGDVTLTLDLMNRATEGHRSWVATTQLWAKLTGCLVRKSISLASAPMTLIRPKH